MNTISSRFKNGLYTASNSFSLLWNNKKLMLYLGIPITLSAIIEILAYNIYFKSTSINLALLQQGAIGKFLETISASGWSHYIWTILIYFIYLTIAALASIALTYHTAMISQQTRTNIGQTMQTCVLKIKKAIIWSCIVLIPIIAFYTLSNYIMKFESRNIRFLSGLGLFVLFITWSLITTFVIPIITLERLTIWRSITKSISVIRSIFFEYLGGIFWIGLITLISATPFLILEKYIKPTFYVSIILILSYIIITIFSCAISTTHTILKTLLFRHYKQHIES